MDAMRATGNLGPERIPSLEKPAPVLPPKARSQSRSKKSVPLEEDVEMEGSESSEEEEEEDEDEDEVASRKGKSSSQRKGRKSRVVSEDPEGSPSVVESGIKRALQDSPSRVDQPKKRTRTKRAERTGTVAVDTGGRGGATQGVN